MEQIRRIMRPTDVPDTGMCSIEITHSILFFFVLSRSCPGLLCDLLW